MSGNNNNPYAFPDNRGAPRNTGLLSNLFSNQARQPAQNVPMPQPQPSANQTHPSEFMRMMSAQNVPVEAQGSQPPAQYQPGARPYQQVQFNPIVTNVNPIPGSGTQSQDLHASQLPQDPTIVQLQQQISQLTNVVGSMATQHTVGQAGRGRSHQQWQSQPGQQFARSASHRQKGKKHKQTVQQLAAQSVFNNPGVPQAMNPYSALGGAGIFDQAGQSQYPVGQLVIDARSDLIKVPKSRLELTQKLEKTMIFGVEIEPIVIEQENMDHFNTNQHQAQFKTFCVGMFQTKTLLVDVILASYWYLRVSGNPSAKSISKIKFICGLPAQSDRGIYILETFVGAQPKDVVNSSDITQRGTQLLNLYKQAIWRLSIERSSWDTLQLLEQAESADMKTKDAQAKEITEIMAQITQVRESIKDANKGFSKQIIALNQLKATILDKQKSLSVLKENTSAVLRDMQAFTSLDEEVGRLTDLQVSQHAAMLVTRFTALDTKDEKRAAFWGKTDSQTKIEQKKIMAKQILQSRGVKFGQEVKTKHHGFLESVSQEVNVLATESAKDLAALLGEVQANNVEPVYDYRSIQNMVSGASVPLQPPDDDPNQISSASNARPANNAFVDYQLLEEDQYEGGQSSPTVIGYHNRSLSSISEEDETRNPQSVESPSGWVTISDRRSRNSLITAPYPRLSDNEQTNNSAYLAKSDGSVREHIGPFTDRTASRHFTGGIKYKLDLKDETQNSQDDETP